RRSPAARARRPARCAGGWSARPDAGGFPRAGPSAQYRRSAGVEEALGVVEFHQASLSDLEGARRHGAREVAVVADEQARHLALLELGLERFLALDVEVVGGLVEQVHVGPQQLHLEEDQPRALAMAQHADRLADPLEREAGRRKLADGVPFA